MPRLWPLAVFLLCLSAGAAANEVLSLCYERKDARPWRTADGEGLDFAMLDAVAKRLNLQLELQALPWKRCLAQVQANAVQGAFSASFSRDRLRVGDFPGGQTPDASKRMHMSTYVLLRKKNGSLRWNGKRFVDAAMPVGYQLGYSVGEQLLELGVTVREMNLAPAQLARELSAGQFAAVALFSNDAAAVLASPLGADLELMPMPHGDKPYFLLLSHGMTKSKPALAEKIWAAIEEIRNSPEFMRRRREAGVEDR